MGEKLETRLKRQGIDENDFIQNTYILGWGYAREKLQLKSDIPLTRFFLDKTGNPNYGRYANMNNGSSGDLFNKFVETVRDRFAEKLIEKNTEIEYWKNQYKNLLTDYERVQIENKYLRENFTHTAEETMLNYIKNIDGG